MVMQSLGLQYIFYIFVQVCIPSNGNWQLTLQVLHNISSYHFQTLFYIHVGNISHIFLLPEFRIRLQ